MSSLQAHPQQQKHLPAMDSNLPPLQAPARPYRSSSRRTDFINFGLDPGNREALERFRRKEGLRSLAEGIRELIHRADASGHG